MVSFQKDIGSAENISLKLVHYEYIHFSELIVISGIFQRSTLLRLEPLKG